VGGLNAYLYANANSINVSDAFGLRGRPGLGPIRPTPTPPNMDPIHPRPGAPQKPTKYPRCQYQTLSCYYEIVCDYKCYSEKECKKRDPYTVYGVSEKPNATCSVVRCYWRYR